MYIVLCCAGFFFSSRRRHTRYWRDWSSDVCSSDLDLGELFEEHSLALHDRHRRPGPYVPQPQNRCPVRDDSHGVALDREVERPLRVLGYGPAYPRDPRRVSHREVVAGAERHLGVHLYLPPEVHEERAVRDVHYPNLRERLHSFDYGAPMI